MADRICYHAGESYMDGDEFAVIKVTENQPGYVVVMSFVRPSYAKMYADSANADLGRSADDVLDIRTSSIVLTMGDRS